MPPGTTLRNIRVEQKLWDAVGAKAALEGRDRSEVIRELMSKWVGRGEPQ